MKKLFFTLLLCRLGLWSADASTDYAPAIYREAYSGHWYTSGNGHKFAVIHDMEGYYLSTISFFQRECQSVRSDGTCAGRSSAHYCINGLKDNTSDAERGEVTQMVREAYYAWHAVCWNTHCVGTEHEGFVSNPAWYTEEMYVASAALQRHFADKFGFAKDRNHIIGHDEKKNSAWVTYASANLGIDPVCNSHVDPGVNWNWSHFMALIVGGPAAPSNLVLAPLSTTQMKLTWTDAATNETGFKIERATAAAGPWSQIATVGINITTYTNSGLVASTVYYYRVRAYNASGDSAYSNVRSATTGNTAPVLTAIGDKSVVEGSMLTFTARATDPGLGAVTLITDFEGNSAGTASVMFQKPSYSGSTRGIDPAITNYSIIATTFPAGHSGTAVLRNSWSFTSAGASPNTNWVRLTTVLSSGFPNPVIDIGQILKFDIYTDKTLKLGIGVRETTNASGTAIGSDGGTTGAIEWAGVTNSTGGAPNPTRTINAGSWQTVQFNFPFESVAGFTGNGTLSTASGLAVLEHLIYRPLDAGSGVYNVYLDNFSVVASNTLTYTLDAGAPAGATIHPLTGVFTWTPTELQGPGAYDITIRVTDHGTPALADFETITIIVDETNNFAPTLAAIPTKDVSAGDLLTFTNTASDADFPVDLTFSISPGAPPDSVIDPATGVFTWLTPSDSLDSTNSITVVVSDNGTPERTASRTFTARVVSRTLKFSQTDSNGNMSLSWNTVAGRKYQVQFKSDLSDATWTDFGPQIVGDGNLVTQNISVTDGTQRFYHIAEVP